MLGARLLNDALATGRERAAAIGETLDETIGRTQHFAEKAAPQLIEALMEFLKNKEIKIQAFRIRRLSLRFQMWLQPSPSDPLVAKVELESKIKRKTT